MKTLWNFFSSIKLTIILAALICVNAAWGSLIAVKHPQFFRAIDQTVLFPFLLSEGPAYMPFTLWIYILVLLIFLFTVNTAVCTADKVASIIKAKHPVQSLFPQIVHVGFLIALLGHLAGSVAGFKAPGNFVFAGASIAVPGAEGLFLRLNGVEARSSEPGGEIRYLKTNVTLLKDGQEVKTGDIEINGPLIYKGIAFYHLDQGSSPAGLILSTGAERYSVGFEGSFKTADSAAYRLGNIYPDFQIDESNRPMTRSREYTNPYIEIISEKGPVGYLALASPGSSVSLDNKTFLFEDFVVKPYAILSINKDPGIWLIITGSSLLVIGMVLLLFFRGERAELVRAGRATRK